MCEAEPAYVGDVGHDVDQAEQLDVVHVETPPRPEHISSHQSSLSLYLLDMNTSRMLNRDRRMCPDTLSRSMLVLW